ncbi:MAG TPA: PKD domain-containing protein [Thermoplasmata archaeon]
MATYFLAGTLPIAGAGPTAPAPTALGLSLAAQPVNGSAPLLVELQATLTPTTTSATFNWTFGDGAFFQEVATSYSAVDHVFPAPGTYGPHVFVRSAVGEANATITIVVLTDTLLAALSASPTNGPAPLTVRFEAIPSGGSGTYQTLHWNFGDGVNGSGPDLNYTYTFPGAFNATLTVVDSSGRNDSASVEIQVAPSPGSLPASRDTTLAVVVLALAILVSAGAIFAVAYRSTLLRRAAPDSEIGPTVQPSPRFATSAPTGPPTPEEMAGPLPERPGADESRRLSERILVHLYWYGRLSSDGVARADSSQAGMARRLRVGQNTLSKALRRLLDAGAVKVELQHVPGASRRLKTYSLTPRGEAVAKTIRAESERR